MTVSQHSVYLLEDYKSDVLLGIEIGFNETLLTVNESTDDPLVICTRVINGQLERDAIVTVQSVQLIVGFQQVLDYQPLFMQITFTPNVTEACLNITITDDTIYETQETFSVTLTTLDIGINLSPDVLSITILDDDGT